MYTTRVAAAARPSRPRHSVENQWDLLAALVPGIAAPDARGRPGRDARGPGRHGPRRQRACCALGIEPADAARRRARQRGQPVPALARVVVRRGGRPRWPAASPNRRIILTSGAVGGGRGPRRSGAWPRDARRAGRRAIARGVRVRSRRAARAWSARAALFIGGDSGPLHIAATTTTPMVVLYGPTLPERSAPWRDPARADRDRSTSATLPCRPCDQRVCVPGDFRCLRGIGA